MTKRTAVQAWRETVFPHIKAKYESDGVPDYPARAQAWNDFTDCLARDNQITPRQYATWTHPPETSPR